jgi:hypothetical protein
MVYKAVMLYGRARLQTVRSFMREDDIEAMLAARSLLERSSMCVAVEIWKGDQRVGKLYRPTDAPSLRYHGAA